MKVKLVKYANFCSVYLCATKYIFSLYISHILIIKHSIFSYGSKIIDFSLKKKSLVEIRIQKRYLANPARCQPND